MTSDPPRTHSTASTSSDLPGWGPSARRLGVAVLAFLAGGYVGFRFSEPLCYAVANTLGRDSAEIKDMMIWCFISTPIVTSALSAWLALVLTGAGRVARRCALIWLILVTLGTVGILFASYDWPKASGTPVVDYELRLPAGLPVADQGDIGLTVWNEKNGAGCYIDRIQPFGGRPHITGTIVVHLDNHAPTMSLRLPASTAVATARADTYVQKYPEGYWRLPYGPTSKLEKEFTSWQKIDFIAPPRAVPSLPPGAYEIRYRLRRYM